MQQTACPDSPPHVLATVKLLCEPRMSNRRCPRLLRQQTYIVVSTATLRDLYSSKKYLKWNGANRKVKHNGGRQRCARGL